MCIIPNNHPHRIYIYTNLKFTAKKRLCVTNILGQLARFLNKLTYLVIEPSLGYLGLQSTYDPWHVVADHISPHPLSRIGPRARSHCGYVCLSVLVCVLFLYVCPQCVSLVQLVDVIMQSDTVYMYLLLN